MSFVPFQPNSMPNNGYTVWSAFNSTTCYFAPSDKEFMFNLVVDDLDEALRQVTAGGRRKGGGYREERVRPVRLVHRPGWQQGGTVAAAGVIPPRVWVNDKI